MEDGARLSRGQGATEYLVLLAVVLIVALVSVALLGFFPGMASDAQETQSRAYWSGASPIAIVEWSARSSPSAERGIMYFRFRNTGAYPITITKIFAKNSTNYISQAWVAGLNETNLSDILGMAPGEESYLGYGMGVASIKEVDFYTTSGCGNSYKLCGADSICQPNAPYGTLVARNFGFEYTTVIDGQRITKRQIGTAPLAIRCGSPT